MLKKIRRQLRRLRHKIARVVLGIEIADRRIARFSRRAKHAHGVAVEAEAQARKAKSKRVEAQLLARAARAHHRAYKAKQRADWWRAFKSKRRGQHAFLQTLLRKNLRRKARWLKKHRDGATPPSGLVTFDGKQVAAWIAQILTRARATGLWNGYLISGWRSIAYSISLCYGICDQPFCPGTCAGATTNHVEIEFPGGAADVTDPAGFQAALRKLGETRLRNELPNDLVHHSNSGR